jgi:hypothetical protein
MAFKMKGMSFGEGTKYKSPQQIKQNSPMDKPLVGNQHKLPAHLKAKIESAPDSPQNLGYIALGLEGAYHAGKYLGKKARKYTDKKGWTTKGKNYWTGKGGTKKGKVEGGYDSVEEQQAARRKIYEQQQKEKKGQQKTTGSGGVAAGMVKAAKNLGKMQKQAADYKKATAKGGTKVKGGTRTWAQGKAASGGNLNALVAKRKGLKKGTPEYAAVQNKINAALGSKKRH